MKQAPHSEITDAQRRAATEELPWSGQQENYLGLNPVLLVQNLTLNP